MTYDDAMNLYGSDKPDIRFDMTLIEMNDVCQNNGFSVFDNAELVSAINVKGSSDFTRKQLDELINYVKTPQIGATGIIYCKYNKDGTSKSSVDKFFDHESKKSWAKKYGEVK